MFVIHSPGGVLQARRIDKQGVAPQRTNVVQTAIARWVLNQHLIHLGIASGEGMHDDLDLAFNCLWADNGDAISREYAGTSALKADFTRTGKRDWRGAMNEYVTRCAVLAKALAADSLPRWIADDSASNSITRILQSAVTDFFKQAALDYILGVNLNAFQDFAARLETSDPGEIVRIAAIRQEAIDTATLEVLPDGEAKLAAWNLLSPSEIDVVRPRKGGKYEEKVLLLSTKAIYIVSYDYNLQKVRPFLFSVALDQCQQRRTEPAGHKLHPHSDRQHPPDPARGLHHLLARRRRSRSQQELRSCPPVPRRGHDRAPPDLLAPDDVDAAALEAEGAQPPRAGGGTERRCGCGDSARCGNGRGGGRREPLCRVQGAPKGCRQGLFLGRVDDRAPDPEWRDGEGHGRRDSREDPGGMRQGRQR